MTTEPRATLPFENTYLYATVETGRPPNNANTPSQVSFIESDNAAASLVQIRAGGLCIYVDVATGRSLASQIMRVTNDGDLLWDTELMTGEEEDRITEDLRAGAIGGDPA